ncbi:MAG TPA: hypothetical protein VEN81_03905 [Planctomycetota bacterium]|nr:hypothetical protein [Planctomycetota bacterium]
MTERIMVGVLGNRDSGKTTTWKKLFGGTVRTGTDLRKLFLSETEYVEVFLVSGSPEERETYVGKLIGSKLPRIVLCSIQYRRDATETIDFFDDHGYYTYVQWLNPGYRDKGIEPDSLGLISYLLYKSATVAIRNGKDHPNGRVQDIREIIYGWAWNNRLIRELG